MIRAARLPVVAVLLSLVAIPAAPAGAQTTGAPAAGSLSLVLERAYSMGPRRVALHGQPIRLRGIVTPYVQGQVVEVTARVGTTQLVRTRRTVQAVGNTGQVTVDFRARKLGRVISAVTSFAAGDQPQRRAFAPVFDTFLPVAGGGARGLRVQFLQQRLAALHYAVNRTGVYDDATARAVLAYRKVNGLPRIFSASRFVYGRMAQMRGGFAVRFKGLGRHAEADISRQVLALINPGGRVYRIYHTATGTRSTPTIYGIFRTYRKDFGTNSLGMVHAVYFIRGYAIHGFRSVPTHRASHGCLRIPIPNARFVYNWMRIGTPVATYP